MPNAGQIQSTLAEEFGCEKPRSTWDTADRSLKKFIEVKVMVDKAAAREMYTEKIQKNIRKPLIQVDIQNLIVANRADIEQHRARPS